MRHKEGGRKVPEERISFLSAVEGGPTLEGVLYLPGSEGPYPGVVMCHPHPLYGGSMFNNVVYAVCDALAEQQVASLKFNFRGVGGSGGQHGNGLGEQEDALGALRCLAEHPRIDRTRLGLAGYSFGARVCVAAAEQDVRVRALAAVSLPTRNLAGQGILGGFHRPTFFIVGNQDSVVAVQELRQFVQSLPGATELVEVPGADHFWGGFEAAVGPAVARFFAGALATQPA